MAAQLYLFWMWSSLSSFKSADKQKNLRAESLLAACLSGGRLSHAVLVEGMDGTLAFAKKIAAALVCGSEQDKPCGKCNQCAKAEKDIHPDIIVYSGGERARSFHVDAVRELKREAYIRPNDTDSKVLILENVQNMTVQAQNALLKIIEEPPGAVTFILTCENKSVLLETVLSRVSVFSLNGGAPQSSAEPDSFDTQAASILDCLIAGREFDALAAFSAYEKDRAGFGNLLNAMRTEAALRLRTAALSGTENRDTSGKLMRIMEVADEIEAGLNQNVGGLLMSVILPAKFKNPQR